MHTQNSNEPKPDYGPDHFRSLAYNSKRRFCCYWHQIDEVLKTESRRVVEVGVGSGFLADYLEKCGIDIATVDIDERLNPTVCASVLDMPLEDKAYDVSVCYEVLEHLPYDNFETGLRELARVSKGPVIISVPDATRTTRVLARLPLNTKLRWVFNTPGLRWPNLDPKGEHRWEIGVKGFPLRRITESICNAGLKLERTFRVFENIRHRFFVMRKDS